MAPAAAPAAEASAPAKKVTVTTGMDFASAYSFRGIPQHFGRRDCAALRRSRVLRSGTASARTSATGTASIRRRSAGNWYESDYYGSVTFTTGKVKPRLLYTSYTSPADSFATVKELAGVFAFDDSTSAFPLNPKVVLAFELGDGEADGGTNKGTYLELGVRPSVKLAPKATLAVGAKTGLSVEPLLRGTDGQQHVRLLRYQRAAERAGRLPARGGTLEAHGGVDFYSLGRQHETAERRRRIQAGREHRLHLHVLTRRRQWGCGALRAGPRGYQGFMAIGSDGARATGSMTLTMPGNNGQERKNRGAALLAAARDEYAAEARKGRGGLDVVARLADRMDGLVRMLFDYAKSQTELPFAVCALGGYGRRALCLHSDLDILIIFDGAIGAGEEAFIKAVFQPLWDLRLSLGQHVRELDDLATPDLSNPEFLLGLLDARLIAGDTQVFDVVLEHARNPAALASLIDPLLELVQQRHAQFNDTLYQLEPDIKQAPGGLRDAAVCRHLRVLRRGPAVDPRSRGASRRSRRSPAAHPVDTAPPGRARRQCSHSRAAGGCCRDDGQRRRPAPAAGRSAHGRLLPQCPGRSPVR